MAIHRNSTPPRLSSSGKAKPRSAFTQPDRAQLQRLTAQLRGAESPRQKQRIEAEIETLITGKELTRSDLALAAYYIGNSGARTDSREAAAEFVDMYRGTTDSN